MQQGLRQRLEQRGHRPGGIRRVARVAPDDPADLAQVELVGEGRRRRNRGEGEEAVQLPWGAGQEVSVGREHLGAQLDRPEGRPADDRAHLVQPEEEGGDDAEVAAAAPDRPVQVGVLLRTGAGPLAAGEHDLRLDQVVDREAALASQVAEAAAEREPADAGGRDDAARHRQPVLVGRGIHFAPGAAAADSRRPGAGVDLDSLQARQVEDHAVVARSQPAAVVAAAAHGQRELVVAGEGDDFRDVAGVGAARDQGGPPVDHRVVHLAGLVVAGVLGGRQLSLESGHLAAGSLHQGVKGAHLFLLAVVLSRLGRP